MVAKKAPLLNEGSPRLLQRTKSAQADTKPAQTLIATRLSGCQSGPSAIGTSGPGGAKLIANVAKL